MKKSALEKIRKVGDIKEAKIVIGMFDAVAKIEAETVEEIEKIYLNRIDNIPGLTGSRLHLVACPRTRK